MENMKETGIEEKYKILKTKRKTKENDGWDEEEGNNSG